LKGVKATVVSPVVEVAASVAVEASGEETKPWYYVVAHKADGSVQSQTMHPTRDEAVTQVLHWRQGHYSEQKGYRLVAALLPRERCHKLSTPGLNLMTLGLAQDLYEEGLQRQEQRRQNASHLLKGTVS
jgi:hypothetical protein